MTTTFEMRSKSDVTPNAATGGQHIFDDSASTSFETLEGTSLRFSRASSEKETPSIDDSSYIVSSYSIEDNLRNLHVTTSPPEEDSMPQSQRVLASRRYSEHPSTYDNAQRPLTGSLFENVAPETFQDQSRSLLKRLPAVNPIRAYQSSAISAAATCLMTRRARGPWAARRILGEVKMISLYEEPLLLGFAPVEDDLYNLVGAILGPSGTPYEGGVFYVRVRYPEEYPMQPPSFCFLTKIYHPNIDDRGKVCLDILGTQWSPALTLPLVLVSILSILSDPDCDDPVVGEVAEVYRTDRHIYEEKARLYTLKYATGIEPSKALIEDPPGLA